MKSKHKCTIEYNDQYDSEFCRACDEWKISKCSDKECEFCKYRPDKPSDIKN